MESGGDVKARLITADCFSTAVIIRSVLRGASG